MQFGDAGKNRCPHFGWRHVAAGSCLLRILASVMLSALVIIFLTSYTTYPAQVTARGMSLRQHTEARKYAFESYAEALRNIAGEDKVVFMSYVDGGARSMALNFYASSIQTHHVNNMLFISSSETLCLEFQARHMPCYVYTSDPASSKVSGFFSKDFIRKMNIRTYMILEALQAGYSVVHSDVDMYFFQHPWPSIKRYCDDCDIATLQDMEVHNAGFLFVRSTSRSVSVYKEMKMIADTTTKPDQEGLNEAIAHGVKDNGLKVRKLPVEDFQCGKHFFQNAKRKFADDHPCPCCVVLHNNWIIGIDQKIYRFREMHMWMNDEDEYYSDPQRKYLTYAYPKDVVKDVYQWDVQKEALRNAMAIGEILNRTVILPRFIGNDNKSFVSLLDCTNVGKFTGVFRDKYRESTFLSHPLVPPSVVESRSNVVFIRNDKLNHIKEDVSIVYQQPANKRGGATSGEILKWFGKNEESILQFHSLYNAFSKFDSASEDKAFMDKCKKGF